jgi:hypothetical protein
MARPYTSPWSEQADPGRAAGAHRAGHAGTPSSEARSDVERSRRVFSAVGRAWFRTCRLMSWAGVP